jgi:uncharacterized phosphosugar-binding protein
LSASPAADFGRAYLEEIRALVDRILDSQGENIAAAAEVLARTIEAGGVIHIFGPGHSHVIAEEAFNRTGGLACVNPIVDRTGGRAEIVEGYAAAILDGHDIREGEALIVSSNTGVNPLPVEMAELAKQKGLNVVAITSLEFSLALKPRTRSGKRLADLADVVLDTCCPYGDALVTVPELPVKIGAGSTIAAMAVLNATLSNVVARLLELGIDPPVLLSERLPGEFEHNVALKRHYADRIRAQFTAMLFY